MPSKSKSNMTEKRVKYVSDEDKQPLVEHKSKSNKTTKANTENLPLRWDKQTQKWYHGSQRGEARWVGNVSQYVLENENGKKVWKKGIIVVYSRKSGAMARKGKLDHPEEMDVWEGQCSCSHKIEIIQKRSNRNKKYFQCLGHTIQGCVFLSS